MKRSEIQRLMDGFEERQAARVARRKQYADKKAPTLLRRRPVLRALSIPVMSPLYQRRLRDRGQVAV